MGEKIRKICFICTGNTCRSPMAEGLFKRILSERGITGVAVESAGVSAFPGDPVSKNAVEALKSYSVDISAHRARPVTKYLADECDLFLCMTRSHADILSRFVGKDKVAVLGDGISDPYGGDEETYKNCADEINAALTGFADKYFSEEERKMNLYKQVDFSNVNITGGFWFGRKKINSDVTLGCVRDQFEKTGRMDAFKFDWKEGMPNRPHIFWDSDVAKWIEAASYVIEETGNKALTDYIEKLIDLIEKNQSPDGYFNIYYTVVEPEERFKHRMQHELYCAGHLMEAAVAYYNATGRDRFLKCMCRYADCIEKAFKIDGTAEFTTPGHEEIELALVKLYRCTKEKRYLELSKFFIDSRGQSYAKEVIEGDNGDYVQDHLPVRKQTTAEGHAVRACYLYSGMADIAGEYGDKELFSACEKIFENIVKKRMYITGGTGSARDGERFTDDYDLPNDTAYAETCAAIALAFFAERMSLISPKAVYADTVERALYNGALSGVSLDGKSFFYENPLEINLTDRNVKTNKAKRMAMTQRAEVFGCSCCPPNIARFIASVGGTVYSTGEDVVFVHQYMDSRASFGVGEREIKIKQSTDYPKSGNIKFDIKNADGIKIALRIPLWCSEFTLSCEYTLIDGYAYFIADGDDFSAELKMTMTPQWYEASSDVWADFGKVALVKGPVVYCLEGADNGSELWKLSADIFEPVTSYYDEKLGLECLEASGYKKTDCHCGHAQLYHPAKGNYLNVKLKFIPYFAFANRGESDMEVWVNKF
ncbi:MAG: glycoside hydrolase family 127 protein [Clostridiales bacterium]|nr:glycoside hydrolase family 127 protein [Clostridiales bacterium]